MRVELFYKLRLSISRSQTGGAAGGGGLKRLALDCTSCGSEWRMETGEFRKYATSVSEVVGG